MVKIFEPNLELPSEISGSLIRGPLTDFSSTGIKDLSTKQTLTIEDDRIVVKSATVDQFTQGFNVTGNVKVNGQLEADTAVIKTVDNGLTVRGDVKIYGILDAGFIRSTEVIVNQRYEKQFLEFASPDGETAGTGFIWRGANNRYLMFMMDPDRFKVTENIDMPVEKSYMIEGTPVLSHDTLGTGVTNSYLRKVGTLDNLAVAGEVNVGDYIYYNPVSQRLSLGTENGNGMFSLFDYINNVELILDSNERGHGVIGTHNTRSLDLVTDHQTRLSISETGNVTIGSEMRDNTVTRVYGKLSVGVNNPTESFEVAGNMKVGNRLFANGNSAPTSGSFQTGDIVWNLSPRPGSYVGWICTQGGSPGVWNPFGKIEA